MLSAQGATGRGVTCRCELRDTDLWDFYGHGRPIFSRQVTSSTAASGCATTGSVSAPRGWRSVTSAHIVIGSNNYRSPIICWSSSALGGRAARRRLFILCPIRRQSRQLPGRPERVRIAKRFTGDNYRSQPRACSHATPDRRFKSPGGQCARDRGGRRPGCSPEWVRPVSSGDISGRAGHASAPRCGGTTWLAHRRRSRRRSYRRRHTAPGSRAQVLDRQV